jgi:hypothetical protein
MKLGLQRVIEKRELVIPRQRREPQRQLCQVGRQRVLVDAVEAALRYQAASVEVLVFVGRNGRPRGRPALPRLDEPRGKGAAGLDQEGARTHSGVAHLEIENLLRRRGLAEPLEGGLERVTDDRLSEAPRRVVAAGAATLVGGLLVGVT